MAAGWVTVTVDVAVEITVLVGVEAVLVGTPVPRTPPHEQALEYRAKPLQALA